MLSAINAIGNRDANGSDALRSLRFPRKCPPSMNHITSFVDMAGRVSRSTETFHRATAAAVVVATSDLGHVRASLPQGGRKWAQTDFARASEMVDAMIRHALAVGAFSVNKRTPAWEKYWVDSLDLENLLRRQDGKAAGFLRAPNFLRFHLMGGAASVAFGHAHWRTSAKPRVLDYRGRALLENDVVFDNDIQGSENEDMLETMLGMPTPRSEQQFGFTLRRRMSLVTEQQEPLLLLADFAAGIVHAALLPEAGKFLPLTQEQANNYWNGLMLRGFSQSTKPTST